MESKLTKEGIQKAVQRLEKHDGLRGMAAEHEALAGLARQLEVPSGTIDVIDEQPRIPIHQTITVLGPDSRKGTIFQNRKEGTILVEDEKRMSQKQRREMEASIADASTRTMIDCPHCKKPQPFSIRGHIRSMSDVTEGEGGFFCDWCGGKITEISGFMRSPKGCIMIRDEKPV
jgi:hypothetical protein